MLQIQWGYSSTSGSGSLAACFALLIVTLGGCVGATYVPTSHAAYPPRAKNCPIEVYTAALPDRDFVEIGIVEGEGSFWKSDTEDVLPKLKSKACRAGGDAIIWLSDDKFSQGEDHYPVLRSVATVVRWTGN